MRFLVSLGMGCPFVLIRLLTTFSIDKRSSLRAYVLKTSHIIETKQDSSCPLSACPTKEKWKI